MASTTIATTKVDEDFHVGTPCDGPDADTCADGVIACATATTTACNDGPDNSPEICDGNDNDCDGQTDEGFHLGTACDGADTDACNEGTIVCDGAGGATCSDTTGNNVEMCNGLDDDCRNGVDDPLDVGQACTVGLGACARTGVAGVQRRADRRARAARPPAHRSRGELRQRQRRGLQRHRRRCPANDLPAGAIDISGGGTFTVDLARRTTTTGPPRRQLDCGDQGGRDVFYQFTLPGDGGRLLRHVRLELRHRGPRVRRRCTALGAVQRVRGRRVRDDPVAGCGRARRRHATASCSISSRARPRRARRSLTFKRGGRAGIALTAAASGSVTGTTTGKTNCSVAGCEANSHQPDVGLLLPDAARGAHGRARTPCTGTSFDTVLSHAHRRGERRRHRVQRRRLRAAATGLQPKITGADVSGAEPATGSSSMASATTGNGAYTLTYSIQ